MQMLETITYITEGLNNDDTTERERRIMTRI
jgi:hypothetical protein